MLYTVRFSPETVTGRLRELFMDDMWKNMKWVVCCLVTLLNTVYSDSEQSIGRIASTERNMVVVWDGSIQAQDFRRMGIHA
ncbi:MAG: hypothetical protein WEB37_01705, partial [Bacteroidota bacterium]